MIINKHDDIKGITTERSKQMWTCLKIIPFEQLLYENH